MVTSDIKVKFLASLLGLTPAQSLKDLDLARVKKKAIWPRIQFLAETSPELKIENQPDFKVTENH